MSSMLQIDLEQCKKRLEYYNQLKAQGTAVDKWIEIYSDRLNRLQKQAVPVGLATQTHKGSNEELSSRRA